MYRDPMLRRYLFLAALGLAAGLFSTPAESGTAVTQKVYSAVSVSSTSTYYSTATEVRQFENVSYQLVWSGTPTGTFTVWVSNLVAPSLVNDTDWISLTLATAISQPAGSASKYSVDLSSLPFYWVRLKYVNASGSGTITAYLVGKGS